VKESGDVLSDSLEVAFLAHDDDMICSCNGDERKKRNQSINIYTTRESKREEKRRREMTRGKETLGKMRV
jgi:hypothetical protein